MEWDQQGVAICFRKLEADLRRQFDRQSIREWMTMSKMGAVALIAGMALMSGSAIAKEKVAKQYVVVNEDVGVPVFAYDITDRPYTVIGEVKAGVRKATVFSKEASQGKIYRELWERAEKMGADAVINAKYGDSHVSVISWGKTNATGTAIKFNAATGTQPAAPAPSN